ncbi:MAG: acylphosphatase [Candidatus Omnitrophota bacterium]|nr:MAG: acylphosphatase [Candidatus Omnitrophota bacterium]
MNQRAVHIYFEGRVQGVGFRFTARDFANRHNVKGWVMNLANGDVELVAEGNSEDLDGFLHELHTEFKSYITDFKVEKISTQGGFCDFQIRFY